MKYLMIAASAIALLAASPASANSDYNGADARAEGRNGFSSGRGGGGAYPSQHPHAYQYRSYGNRVCDGGGCYTSSDSTGKGRPSARGYSPAQVGRNSGRGFGAW